LIRHYGAVQLACRTFCSRRTTDVSLQEASLIALIEPVLNPLWVALIVKEIPSVATLAGAGMILVGLGLRYVWPLCQQSAAPAHVGG